MESDSSNFKTNRSPDTIHGAMKFVFEARKNDAQSKAWTEKNSIFV